MKSLFTAIALAAVISSQAHAQDLRNLSNRKDAVLAIGQTHNLTIKFDTEPSGPLAKTDLTGVPWQEALTEVLTPYNRWYQTTDGAVHIVTMDQWKLLRNSPASAVNRQATAPAAPVQAQPTPSPVPPPAVQRTYEAPAIVASGVTIPRLGSTNVGPCGGMDPNRGGPIGCSDIVTDAYGRSTTVQYTATPAGYVPIGAGGYSFYPQQRNGYYGGSVGVYGSIGNYGNRGDWFGLPIFDFQIEDLRKRTELRWSRGQLRIKGGKECDSRCLSNVHIVAKINGEEIYIAGAKFGNNWYEHPIRVPLIEENGVTKAEFWIVREMKETDGKMRGFVRKMFVPSMGETNQVTNLPVSLNEFVNAREIRLMNQHVLTEDEKGNFVAENRQP